MSLQSNSRMIPALARNVLNQQPLIFHSVAGQLMDSERAALNALLNDFNRSDCDSAIGMAIFKAVSAASAKSGARPRSVGATDIRSRR